MFNMIEKIEVGKTKDRDALLAILVARMNEVIEATNYLAEDTSRP